MSQDERKLTVAKRPCSACPYRRDVPSGIWAAEEYAKLPAYDRETGEQPPGVFLCHDGDRRSQVCLGWAQCHPVDHLLSLRIMAMVGCDVSAVVEAGRATPPVPLFGSGAEAAAHGLAELISPGAAAQAAIGRLRRRLSRADRRRVNARRRR